MCINAPLGGQCSIVRPSAANIDRGTTLNSYVPTASLMSLSGRSVDLPSLWKSIPGLKLLFLHGRPYIDPP